MYIWSALWLLLAWCFSNRASVATVLSTHPCISSCFCLKELHAVHVNHTRTNDDLYGILAYIHIKELLMFHLWLINKIYILWVSYFVWVRYFVWNFKGYLWNSAQNTLAIYSKIPLLSKVEILRAFRFKKCFKTPPRPCCIEVFIAGLTLKSSFII